MNEDLGFRETLVQIAQGLIARIVDITPRVMIALIVLLVGLLLAKIVEKILVVLLKKLRFDNTLGHLGATRVVQRLGVRAPISVTVSKAVYYLLVLLFSRAAAESAGLTIVANVLGTVLGYLPNVLAALLVIVGGSFVAQLAGRAVANASGDSGVAYAKSLGRLVSGGVLLVVAIISIGHLGIDTTLIGRIVVVSLMIFGGGTALAFGLGTRDIVHNLVAGFYVRKLFRVGDPIAVDKHTGTLQGITPTKVILDLSGEIISIPNTTLLHSPVSQGMSKD